MKAYQNKELSIKERLEDLLSRMSLEEKIGQMIQLPAKKGIVEENFVDKLEEWHIGSFLHCTGTQAEEIQQKAEKTRLGIPVIFGIDAIHGHCFEDNATVFPTQLAMSCSWNPELMKAMGRITAKEVRACGLHWTFSPVLCIGRDPRWGRIDETFGEDSYLIGELAAGAIEGYQGESLSQNDSILACAKHYAAYGESTGGRDSYESEVSKRKMMSIFLPPFEKAVKNAKTATLMTGYQAIDGIPATSNRWLLQETAKDNWKLKGFIVTDWNNVGALVNRQRVAADMKEAARQAIEAGNDMMMSTPEFFDAALALVKEGIISEKRIEESAARVLKVKFEMGLFDENRYTPENARQWIGLPEHWEQSLEASRQSLTLLTNKGVLPLKKDSGKKILLTGPNADDIIGQLGDWSFGSMQAGATNENYHKEDTIILLQALKEAQQQYGYQLDYIKGADILDSDFDETAQARSKAEEADLVIACVGDTIQQHGEGHDRSDLNLTGKQQLLLETLKSTGTPMVVVFMASKPLTIPWIKEQADALLCAFNPGAKGGQAIKEALFGDLNPSGKLTISFPYSTGQLPIHYNKYQGWHCDNGDDKERYLDCPEEALFSFGEGLSYTSFKYSDLVLSSTELIGEEILTASVTLSNTGDRQGTEITQCYLSDLISSVTTPVKELKGFRRTTLEPGESVTLEFSLTRDDMTLIDGDLQKVAEPGEFKLSIGASSRDEDCLSAHFHLS